MHNVKKVLDRLEFKCYIVGRIKQEVVMAIVSVGMFRGNEDILACEDDNGYIHISASLSGIGYPDKISCLPICKRKEMYYIEPDWAILDKID
jgi:hypothetical protein